MHARPTRATCSGHVPTAAALACCALAAIGGCPRAEDRLEPNDSLEDATPVVVGEGVEGRVVQGNPDLFTVTVGGGSTLRFTLDSIGEEEESCAAFLLTAPDGRTLYDDNLRGCGRGGLPGPIQVSGAVLEHSEGVGYILRAPAVEAGTYALTITELGHADNLFTYSWRYRLTVTEE